MKKKIIKKSNIQDACQTLKIIGGAISSHNFFPISEHFQISQENQNQLIRSKKIAATGGKMFLDYLKRKDFYSQSKKTFLSLITAEPVYV